MSATTLVGALNRMPGYRVADELAKAITKIIYPALKPEGFRRVRKRDLMRVENGIVQLLYFQVSAWGSRDFCVTACANLIAGNESVTLGPGFRVPHDAAGRHWLPSKTANEAEHSARLILQSIQSQALPFFEKCRSLSGFSAILAEEQWASDHHLHFQRGVVAAMIGDVLSAQSHLDAAIQRYRVDGREWTASYAQRATALQEALAAGSAAELLAHWEQANAHAHGVM